MINAIAIDDEPPALKVIETFCSDISFIQLDKTFTQPSEALKHIKKNPVDLLFLDIHMPSISGIDFHNTLPESKMVIFTTAHSEYAVEGFNLNAIDYLLKPFSLERFKQAALKAQDYYNYIKQGQTSEKQFLFVRADYMLHKINFDDILFIEGLDDYLKIHIENQKTIVARMTMKNIFEKLSSKNFIRIHRSFIVPFKRIESIHKKTIKIAGNELPIGKSYEQDFSTFLK